MNLKFEDLLLSTGGKIATSLATATASFCLGRFWLSFLRPWVQSFWWTGTTLSATYKGEFKYQGTGNILHDHVELNQNAERIWGTMTVPDGKWGKYEFKATFQNGVVRGTWESVGKNTHARGSFLLATQQGSSDLAGWCMEPINGVVIAYEYKWYARP